jgi:hypothetical protein
MVVLQKWLRIPERVQFSVVHSSKSRQLRVPATTFTGARSFSDPTLSAPAESVTMLAISPTSDTEPVFDGMQFDALDQAAD